jgi:hypothetical protein
MCIYADFHNKKSGSDLPQERYLHNIFVRRSFFKIKVQKYKNLLTYKTTTIIYFSALKATKKTENIFVLCPHRLSKTT